MADNAPPPSLGEGENTTSTTVVAEAEGAPTLVSDAVFVYPDISIEPQVQPHVLRELASIMNEMISKQTHRNPRCRSPHLLCHQQ